MSASDIAVSVRGLSKSYTIAHNAQQHTTAAEALVSKLRHPFQKPDKETFWALRDVEFDIKKGDVVGIIGRNGAGKSTLLKILSRITEPTTGQIDLYGRVGSLLEVGTGFHPELTGRENIYLNGAILGMSKREIAREFDAIVDFSGTEQFLDTPVKRYSSGMYVRLAFAVSAHLASDILIVDEVLAVGDADFQKRCLGKMEEVGASGRTVLFVSHSMPMIQRLCNQAVLMHKGRVADQGSPQSITATYMHTESSNSAACTYSFEEAPGDHVARIKSVRVTNSKGCAVQTVDVRDVVNIEVEYWLLRQGARPKAILQFINEAGQCLFSSADFLNNIPNHFEGTQVIRAKCYIPSNLLAEGQIFVLAALGQYNPNIIHALVQDAVSFQVVDYSEGYSARGDCAMEWPGLIRPLLEWNTEYDQESAS